MHLRNIGPRVEIRATLVSWNQALSVLSLLTGSTLLPSVTDSERYAAVVNGL